MRGDESVARRRIAPEQRRDELLDAALRVLRNSVGVAESANWVALVTTEAGTAKGTFYRHFPSWEAMLAAVRDLLLDRFHAPLRAALDRNHEADWRQLLISHSDALTELFLEFPLHHGMVFHAPLPDRPVDPLVTGANLIAGVLEHGIADGAFRSLDDIEVTASLLFSGMHTVSDAILTGEDPIRWRTAWITHMDRILLPPL